MTPLEIFQEARLADAIAAQRDIVRTRADDVAERLLLCDFLAFAGDRMAVREHLNSLKSGPAVIQEYLLEWHALLNADDARYAGNEPSFAIEPPASVLSRVRALGDTENAIDLIDSADEAETFCEGHVDGREFEGWRDADELLGPVLEAFVGGKYFWIPMEHVRKLRFAESEALRDSLYRPATIRLTNGRSFELFLPAIYAGSDKHEEEGIRIGAGIDWVESSGLMRGLGERTFLFGEDEIGISEIHQVEVRPA